MKYMCDDPDCECQASKPEWPEAEKEIREFETGATRDTDDGKLDYEGFLSPTVLRRYAEYMNKNRVQKDGSVRDSDNWQKGIPQDVYMKSLLRHTFELWENWRLDDPEYPEDQDALEEALCAIMFNAMGFLYEELGVRKTLL